jgi:mannose-6-phosphate isomerase
MLSFIGKDVEQIRTWLREHRLTEALTAQIGLPLIPLPDNFTAPTRMPWGGTKIIDKYKQGLPIRPEKQYSLVGESWELSADPIAPSQFIFELEEESILIDLIQLLDLFPDQILGPRVAAKFEGQNPILLKIIDSADHLSVQVHPADNYVRLRPHESGKPECWYILEAAHGAGLYLGLKERVSKDALRRAIEQEEDVSQYLNFVEVHPGDFFVIDAGTIHAVGAGVTLIEPQKIAPKKSGKTYRLWDWNRKYDAQGNLNPNGKSRELHIEECFDVITFDGPRGTAFVNQIQPPPRLRQQNGASVEMVLLETENFGVSRIVLEGGRELTSNCTQSFHGIVLYEGQMEISKQGKKIAEIRRGQSVILPAELQAYMLKGEHTQGVKVYYPEQFLP